MGLLPPFLPTGTCDITSLDMYNCIVTTKQHVSKHTPDLACAGVWLFKPRCLCLYPLPLVDSHPLPVGPPGLFGPRAHAIAGLWPPPPWFSVPCLSSICLLPSDSSNTGSTHTEAVALTAVATPIKDHRTPLSTHLLQTH